MASSVIGTLTVHGGLARALALLQDRLPPEGLRPEVNRISPQGVLGFRWDFDTGGVVDLAFSFVIVREGAGMDAARLVPHVHLSASIGAMEAAAAVPFADNLAVIARLAAKVKEHLDLFEITLDPDPAPAPQPRDGHGRRRT